MEVDTDLLGEGEFVTFIYEPALGERKEICPRCMCERSDWDCEGCGYEFMTPLPKPRPW